MLLPPIFECFYQSHFPYYLAVCEISAFTKVSNNSNMLIIKRYHIIGLVKIKIVGETTLVSNYVSYFNK